MALNGFAAAALAAAITLGTAADAAVLPSLRVAPTTVSPGDQLTVSGLHWGANKKVTFLVGRPKSEATALVGSTKTNAAGAFTGKVPVLKNATPGTYILLACRKSCAIKRTKTIHIVAGRRAVAAATPTLKLTPSTVKQGQNMTITGTKWPALKNVTLKFLATGAAPATIKTLRTTSAGKFSLTLPIKPTSPTGTFKIRAVYKTTKVTKPFTVVAGR